MQDTERTVQVDTKTAIASIEMLQERYLNELQDMDKLNMAYKQVRSTVIAQLSILGTPGSAHLQLNFASHSDMLHMLTLPPYAVSRLRLIDQFLRQIFTGFNNRYLGDNLIDER